MEFGHAFIAHETNSGSFVPLCECGWQGPVVPFFGDHENPTQRKARRREITVGIAVVRHGEHLVEERARIAAEHALAMRSHAAYVQAVAPTVRKIGRWGAG